ncbi:MAG: VWA domain-containing protein [Acidobacteriota bacterium]|nr:VWA domain-containing protein [Acidobacteriota bacterium]
MIFFIPLLLIVHLRGQNQPPPKSEASDAAPTFRTGVADVRVDAQVLQDNKVVEGLKQEDFAVTDQGVEQKINYFGHDAEPVSLLLLLDISGSMTRWIPRISETAREALGYLSPGDRVAIMVFGKRAEIHQDFSDNLAESARQISTVVRNHDVGAGTLINLAVIEAARYMQKNAPQQGRRAILILTDNLSISVMTPDTAVVRALDEADTVLNAIVVGRAIRPSPPKPGEYRNPDFTPADVFHLAEETGGEAVKADHPETSFAEIIDRIRRRYSLSYRAPEGAGGSFRRIGVTLTELARKRYPLAEVKARRGYYVR